jgi:hypothetical protein
VALIPGGPQLLAHERHRLVLIEVAALADEGYERAQVVRADRSVDDLDLAEVRLVCRSENALIGLRLLLRPGA